MTAEGRGGKTESLENEDRRKGSTPDQGPLSEEMSRKVIST